MNNYDPDRMTLEQLIRLDMRRVPDPYDEQGAMRASVNYELLDSYGERVQCDMIHEDEERYRVGKNHHRDGTISTHLLDFRLLTARGEISTCSREENAEPQNLTKDAKYASDVFEWDEERRTLLRNGALLRNGEPVGLRALSWK